MYFIGGFGEFGEVGENFILAIVGIRLEPY